MPRKQSPLRQGLEILFKAGQITNGYSIDEAFGSITVETDGGEGVTREDAATLRALGWKLETYEDFVAWEFTNPNGLRAMTVDNVLNAIGVPH